MPVTPNAIVRETDSGIRDELSIDDDDEVKSVNNKKKKSDNVLKLMQMIKYDKNEKPITSLQLSLFWGV